MEEAKEAAKEKEEIKEAPKSNWMSMQIRRWRGKLLPERRSVNILIKRPGNFVFSNRDNMDKVGDYKDYAKGKAKGQKESIEEYVSEKVEDNKKTGEYKEYASEKATEAKDFVLEKADEFTDYSVGKANETKDYLAEKAEEERDGALRKLGKLKESAKDVKKKVVDVGSVFCVSGRTGPRIPQVCT
ncbi:hypothetical protein K2173_019573 [Erythroxylum novogranatense]|uniref:Uncharacterized protein n=1 Tax=Erythroxylum novogranatense TaxID=1862640 RepID=A0AAV8UBR5_9ROSI|nr:hypothetical protein K2173_019573 [Erythroxylum novogranatense]